MQKTIEFERFNLSKKVVFIIFVAGIAVLWGGTSLKAQDSLISPYRAIVPSVDDKDITPAMFRCPIPPRVITHLLFESIYTSKDDGSSIVDPAAQKKYKADTILLRTFENRLSQMVMMAEANPVKNRAYGECALRWLNHWAQGDAMLGKANAQGQAVRKWSLATFSALYIQIQDNNYLPDLELHSITKWLHTLAVRVKDDYSQNIDAKSRQNNHLYWAAWAVMITAIVTNDHDLFDWSTDQYKFAVMQIGKDGTLPLEMARMGKAFNYHVFAVAPLIMMAETAQKNNVDLYKYNHAALKRLVDRILTELETNQAYMMEKTQRTQNLDGTLTPGQMAWMEPYYTRYKEPRMERWILSLRPMEQRRTGGDMTFLYQVN